MTSLRSVIVPALLALVCLTLSSRAKASEGLVPKDKSESFRRPDIPLRELRGKKAGRREVLEEKSEAIDRRLETRREAREDAIDARRGKPSELRFKATLSLGAVFLEGTALRSPPSAPGDEVDLRADLGVPQALIRPRLELDLTLRKLSGAFLHCAYLSGSARATVDGDGLLYDGTALVSDERVETLWECILAGGGVYYVFSPLPDAFVRASAGVRYLRTNLVVERVSTGLGRIIESCDAFFPFLELRGRFALSADVSFAPRATLGYLWFGTDKYRQNNFTFEGLLALSIPLAGHVELLVGYRFHLALFERTDRGAEEANQLLLHGPECGVTVRIG